MTRPTRSENGESGSELIEFALVFPLLLMVVLAIVDFGFLFQRYEVLTNAAREGARVAVLSGYDETDVENRVMSYVQTGGVPTTATNPVITVADTTITAGTNTFDATTVIVSYDHTYLFIGAVASWFGGSFGSVTLATQATMRDELASGGGGP